MDSLTLIQKSLFEIKHKIQSNANIRKMLYYDSKSALSQNDPGFNEVEDHILISGIFDVTEPPYDKNTLITIYPEEIYHNDSAYHTQLAISVITRPNLWELKDNKIRPLEVVNQVIKEIDNFKLSPSVKLSFVSTTFFIVNKNIGAYKMTFRGIEGDGKLDERY